MIHVSIAAPRLIAQRVTITEGTNIAVAASPNGETLAFDLQGTLWSMPASGGNATGRNEFAGDWVLLSDPSNRPLHVVHWGTFDEELPESAAGMALG